MAPIASSQFFPADDGLRLHLRLHRPEGAQRSMPLVCLPGLTRSADDFAPLATALAGSPDAPRTVIAFDYRGRGLSAHDDDWRRYDLRTERADLLAGLRHLGIAKAHFLGTSRGGLQLMAMAEDHRALMGAVILNDIGPVLEIEGLRRIKSYVGVPASPGSLTEAVAILRSGAGLHFDGLSPAEWELFATTTFGTDPAHLRQRYDLRLARTLDGLDLDKPLPENWAGFDALAGRLLLAIRGEHSDLLSPAVHEAMGHRWAGCEAATVPGQGHAPLLADAATISRIDAFLAHADVTKASAA